MRDSVFLPQSVSLFCGALAADHFTACLAVKCCQYWQAQLQWAQCHNVFEVAPPPSKPADSYWSRENCFWEAERSPSLSQILGAAAHRLAVQGETAITRVETPNPEIWNRCVIIGPAGCRSTCIVRISHNAHCINTGTTLYTLLLLSFFFPASTRENMAETEQH